MVYGINLNPTTESCVYKLYYDGKYVIVKAKNMQQSGTQIQKSLNQYLRGADGQQGKDKLYKHLFEYVQAHPGGEFSHELILAATSPFLLLKAEQEALDAARRDPACLNNNTEAYIPAYNDTSLSFGWVDTASFLNFKKWLKNRPAPKKKRAKQKT